MKVEKMKQMMTPQPASGRLSARTCVVLGTATAALVFAANASAAIVYTSNAADAQVDSSAGAADGGGTVSGATAATLRFANRNSGTAAVMAAPVYVFQLPDVGAVTDPFSSASFSVALTSSTAFTQTNVDVYGLDARAAATVLGGDYYVGANDTTGATRILNNWFNLNVTPAVTTGVKTTSVAALTTYLNTQYASGTNAGKYVFIRLSAEASNTIFGNNQFAASENSTAANRPQLTFQSAPSLTQSAVIGYTQSKVQGTATDASVTLVGSNGSYEPGVVNITDSATGYIDIVGQSAQSASDTQTRVLLDLEGYTTANGGTLNTLLTFLQNNGAAYGYTVTNLTGNSYTGITGGPLPGWAAATGSSDYEVLLTYSRATGLTGTQRFSFDFAQFAGVTVDQIAVIPEPMSGAAVVLGLCGVGMMRRRRSI